MSFAELLVWAATVMGEAEGEPFEGKLAVAYVIWTRGQRGPWPSSPADVCLQSAQFSPWNTDSGTRRAKMLTSTSAAMADCMFAVLGAVSGRLTNPMPGSDHFHAVGSTPSWRLRMLKVGQVGRHIFYNSTRPATATEV